jgi:protein-arginine kinase
MFFPGMDTKSGKEVLAKITREVYLTNNLAVKLLISIDVIVPENINIIISKKAGYIRSCSTNIIVKVS